MSCYCKSETFSSNGYKRIRNKKFNNHICIYTFICWKDSKLLTKQSANKNIEIGINILIENLCKIL